MTPTNISAASALPLTTFPSLNSLGFAKFGDYANSEDNRPAGGMVWIAITGTWSGTLSVYASPSKTKLVAVPVASIQRYSSGATGAIASGSEDFYLVQVPPGPIYVIADAWVSGVATVAMYVQPQLQGGTTGGATDVSALAKESGGNLALMAALISGLTGATNHSYVSAKTVLKGTAGACSKVTFDNASQTTKFYALYFDAATTAAVTLGTTVPIWSTPVPPNGCLEKFEGQPLKFAAGLVMAIVTLQAGSVLAPADPVSYFTQL